MFSRWAAVATAAVLGAIAVVSTVSAPPRLLLPEVLEGYRATYRIVDRASDEASVRTEVLEVARPYSGRVETRQQDSVVTGTVTNRELELQLASGAEVRFAIRRQPGGPVRDVSYAALRDAAQAGIVEVAGRGSAHGRACTWFASGAPAPEALRPPGAERVEACVDPFGVLIREVWTIGGRVVRETDLVAFDERAPAGRRFFEGRDITDIEVQQPEAADVLRGHMVVSDDARLPDPSLGLEVPRGWRRDRESGVVVASPLDASASQTSVVSFLGSGVRAGQVVVVERSIRADPPTWPDEGPRIDAGPGVARIVFFASHVEIRVRTNADGFARILAPDRDIAERFAEGLRVG